LAFILLRINKLIKRRNTILIRGPLGVQRATIGLHKFCTAAAREGICDEERIRNQNTAEYLNR
jgi:hypothetical protein